MEKLKYKIRHYMNHVLPRKKSEIIFNKFALQWSKSTYWRYEGATFDSEKEDIENPNYEILDYFRREFNLNSIDDLFTDEYKNYRDQYLEKRLQGLEELVQKALENLNISKGGNPCQD